MNSNQTHIIQVGNKVRFNYDCFEFSGEIVELNTQPNNITFIVYSDEFKRSFGSVDESLESGQIQLRRFEFSLL